MIIDLDTLKWILAAIVSPAVLAIFLWLTQKYWPARQKHSDDTANSIQTFSQQSQGSALGQVLQTQEQLIDHVIASNNGHLSNLTSEVRNGFSTQNDSLRDIESSINILLEILSRQPAYRNLGRDDDFKTAIIKSRSDKKADAVIDDMENASE